MGIHFPEGPNRWHLCLMAGGDRPGRAFIDPTRLDRANIRQFVDSRQYFLGKFVFDKIGRQLAICQGDDLLHYKIARVIQEPGVKTDLIGAFILFEKYSTEIVFGLHGISSRYGTPSVPELRMVAEHIRDLLLPLGYDPLVEEGPTGGFFVTIPLG